MSSCIPPPRSCTPPPVPSGRQGGPRIPAAAHLHEGQVPRERLPRLVRLERSQANMKQGVRDRGAEVQAEESAERMFDKRRLELRGGEAQPQVV